MPAAQDIMMVPLRSSSPSLSYSSYNSGKPLLPNNPNDSSPLENIQFFIISAHGLPESPTGIRNRRIVRASCSSKSKKYEQYRTNISMTYHWGDNTPQIGPVLGTDRITFSVEGYAILQVVKRFANTIATSAPYTIDYLLEMQAIAKDKSISIPLQVHKQPDNQEAFLRLRVKQPTADFISKQLQEETKRLAEKEEREEGEGSPNGPNSTQTSSSEPSPTLQLDAKEAKRPEIVKGKQHKVHEGLSKLSSFRDASTD